MSWKKYHDENIRMKKQVYSVRHELESSNEDKKKVMEKNKKQSKVWLKNLYTCVCKNSY